MSNDLDRKIEDAFFHRVFKRLPMFTGMDICLYNGGRLFDEVVPFQFVVERRPADA